AVVFCDDTQLPELYEMVLSCTRILAAAPAALPSATRLLLLWNEITLLLSTTLTPPVPLVASARKPAVPWCMRTSVNTALAEFDEVGAMTTLRVEALRISALNRYR